MIALEDVTLISVAGVQIDESQAALQKCMSGMTFGRVMLLAPEPPASPDPRIEYRRVPPMTLHGYNVFMLKQLVHHIDTRHVLSVHPDGYVLNPERWDPDWLNFDYVGAPWPERLYYPKAGGYLDPANRVGNSGFCLRSRRLLELVEPIDLSTLRFVSKADDAITCILLYDYLTQKGMRFADIESAARFSIEDPKATFGQTLDTVFGFHGKHFLAELQARESAAASERA